MKNLYNVLTFFFCTALVVACGSKEEKASDNTTETTTEGAAVEEQAPAEMVEAVCIWDGISVRETPSADGKWVSSITLGETVMLTGQTAVDSSAKNRAYVEVKLGDGKTGWVVEDFVKEGKGVAVLSETTIFKRPDLLTKTEKAFSSMDVLVVLDTKEDWAEVKGKSQGEKWFWEGWVKRSTLSEDKVDIAVSVYAQKALEKDNEEEKVAAIQEIIDNETFASSTLIGDLREKLTEMSAPEEEVIELDTTSTTNLSPASEAMDED